MSPSPIQVSKNPGHRIALVTLHAGYSHSSLALQSIAAYCARNSTYSDVHIFETLVNSNHQHLLEQLDDLQPAVIGFSTYLWNITATLRLCQIIKQLLPNTLIILGGPEAGPRGMELLKNYPILDFIVDGEGEKSFRDLLIWHFEGKGELAQISGLAFRTHPGIQCNPIQTLAVEEVPAPLADGMMDLTKPLVYWETSRGCPFKCSFCTSASDRLRAFPLERIEQDLQVIETLEHKVIKLLDRSFHLGKARTLKLLQRFVATPDGIRFHLELNPDRISVEAMSLFRRASPGKFQFEIGLQTLNEEVLNSIERKMQIPLALENIRELVAMARHPLHLDLIVGLPGDDAAHCRDSLNRTFQLLAEHLQLGILKILPGTPLSLQAEQLGYRWDSAPPYEVLSHPLLSFREIALFKRYAELLERFWNSGYLVSTLSWLIPRHFADQLTDCFDAMLAQLGEGVVRDNLQPDALFAAACDFLAPYLVEDQVLATLLPWDYCQFGLISRRTPEWIREQLQYYETHVVACSRRRLPVFDLSPQVVSVINQRRWQPLRAGQYAVWPRQHKKGKPVEIIPLNLTEG